MHLRTDRLAPCIAALLLCLAVPPGRAGEAGDPAGAGVPTIPQVEAASDVVAADPDLGAQRTIRTLRWIDDGEEQVRRERSGIMAWIGALFEWIALSARLLVWVLCAVLAALIVVYVLRLAAQRARARMPADPLAPTHVRDLDIRPESLPDDIGATARQLWDEGEARRALALLYRGLLSRLAHAHQAPVRDSTTEGESVMLARRCLPADGGEFAAGLVQTWLRAVYGGRMPETTQVHGLCAGFAPALDPPPAAEAATP